MPHKLQQAITLIKSGDIQQGKQLLAEILKTEPRNEVAWLWMSNVVSTDEQRLHCLKQVLLINPDHPLAQKGLALLQQKRQLQQVKPPHQPVQSSSRPQGLPASKIEPTPPPLSLESTAAPRVESRPRSLPPEPKPAISPKPPVFPSLQTGMKASAGAEVSTAEPLKRPKGLNLPAFEILPEVVPVGVPAVPVEPAKEVKRVWINRKADLKLVVLCDDAIAVASPSDKELERLQVILDQRTSLSELLSILDILGSKVKRFYFKEINSIKANPEADSLHILSTKDQKVVLQRVAFANEKTLDEFVQALQVKLGPRFERSVKKYGLFEASTTPLIILGVIIFATYIFYGAAVEAAAGVEPEIRGRRALLKLIFAWLIMLLGPKGVLVVGILLTALVLFWLVARITNPPTKLILTPVQNRPVAQTQVKVASPVLQASPDSSISTLEKTKSKAAGLSEAPPVLNSLPQKVTPSKHTAEVVKPKRTLS